MESIINYFETNPKNNPVIPIISILYAFFSKLLILHATHDKSDNNLASVLSVNRFFIRDYLAAARNYPINKVISVIHDLRHADLQSKW